MIFLMRKYHTQGGVRKLKKMKMYSALVLAAVLILGALLYVAARPEETEPGIPAGDYMEYENAVVDQILTDSTEEDPVSEGHRRGTQLLLVTIRSGQYEGDQLMADNTVGPMYGQSYKVGQSLTVGISTYEDGSVRCYVYEYNRLPSLLIILGLFLVVTVLVGGKVGAF